MATITLDYNPHSVEARQALAHILSLGVFSITEKKSRIPKGYMTGEEFRKRAMLKVNKFCDKHDIL